MRCDFCGLLSQFIVNHTKKSHFIENLYFCLKRIAYLSSKENFILQGFDGEFIPCCWR